MSLDVGNLLLRIVYFGNDRPLEQPGTFCCMHDNKNLPTQVHVERLGGSEGFFSNRCERMASSLASASSSVVEWDHMEPAPDTVLVPHSKI
jgi:hypothetical protein